MGSLPRFGSIKIEIEADSTPIVIKIKLTVMIPFLSSEIISICNSAAWAKMNLNRAKNIFTGANNDSIVILSSKRKYIMA